MSPKKKKKATTTECPYCSFGNLYEGTVVEHIESEHPDQFEAARIRVVVALAAFRESLN